MTLGPVSMAVRSRSFTLVALPHRRSQHMLPPTLTAMCQALLQAEDTQGTKSKALPC